MSAYSLGNIINGVSNNMANRSHGIPTGFTKLDEALYGLHSELIVVGGRPSMGKSSFIADLAINVSSVAPVLIFSLEMSHIMLSERMLANMSEIPLRTLMDGKVKPELEKRRKRALLCLQNRDIIIDDDCALTPAKISERIGVFCNKVVLPTMQSSKYKKSRGAVFIDYLQLLRTKEKTGNREQEISMMSRKCKTMAVDLGVPVILMSQLNREVEKRADKRPMLSDLRESGSIEQDADIVMFVYRDFVYNEDSPEDIGEIIISKHREGAIGFSEFKHNPSMTRFADYYREDNRIESIIPDIDLYSPDSMPF